MEGHWPATSAGRRLDSTHECQRPSVHNATNPSTHCKHLVGTATVSKTIDKQANLKLGERHSYASQCSSEFIRFITLHAFLESPIAVSVAPIYPNSPLFPG